MAPEFSPAGSSTISDCSADHNIPHPHTRQKPPPYDGQISWKTYTESSFRGWLQLMGGMSKRKLLTLQSG